MRRTTALLAAVLAATLTACGGSDSDSKAESSPSTSPTYKLRPQDQFIQAVNAGEFESWAGGLPTAEELWAFPEQWCTELKAGHSVDWLLGEGDLYPMGENWGTKKPEAQELVVLGVSAYCPELRDQVTAELRESGGY